MRRLPFLLLGVAVAAPAMAQSVQFSAVAQSEIGYGTNPFLVPGVTKGTVFASASIAPQLLYQTARSTTTLQGQYRRESYFEKFGYTDSGSIGLTRTDQLSQYLSSTLTGSYATSNGAIVADPNQPVRDPLDIGRRSKILMGSYQLQWQTSARDQISYGAQFSHQNYGNSRAPGFIGVSSNYTQYGTNVGYNHTVDSRTSVGAQVSLSTVRSKIYPDSRTIQPSLTARRQLTAVWEIDGHIGMVFSRIEGPFAESTNSLGIGVNLCGQYPRTHICLKLSRDTQPTGHGPLQKTTVIAGQLTHQLNEHSRLSVNAQFVRDSSDSFTTRGTPLLGNSKLVLATADYDRDLTQRVSAGFGGRFQWRSLENLPVGTPSAARSYTGTIHVRAKLGRM